MSYRQTGMDGPPLKLGAIFGAGTFVVGYIITLAIVAIAEADEISDELIEGAGWVFYSAQFADITVSAGGESESFNIVTGSGTGFDTGLEMPSILYHLIPVLLLLGAGFFVAKLASAQSPGEGAVAGGTLVLGTLIPAIIGSFVFSISFFGVSASPGLLQSLIFVGVAFPAIFGAIGGVIGSQA